MALTYRLDINGLRAVAVAVVPVMLFHAGLGGLAAGFLGVDVFFVISGFLITDLLLQDINARCNAARMLPSRARRILPALLAMLLICSPMTGLARCG